MIQVKVVPRIGCGASARRIHARTEKETEMKTESDMHTEEREGGGQLPRSSSTMQTHSKSWLHTLGTRRTRHERITVLAISSHTNRRRPVVWRGGQREVSMARRADLVKRNPAIRCYHAAMTMCARSLALARTVSVFQRQRVV